MTETTPIKKPKAAVVTTKPTESPVKAMVSGYLEKDLITADFSTQPTFQKLAYLQLTPAKFIKRRDVGSKKIPYLPYQYAQKALNIVFNFHVSAELVAKEIVPREVNKKKVYDAWAEVRFTFIHPETKHPIVRTVIATHRAYENPALTPHEALKSAMSKAWTVVAGTFGIGKDIADREERAVETVQKSWDKGTYNKPVEKSFTTGTPTAPTTAEGHTNGNFEPNFD